MGTSHWITGPTQSGKTTRLLECLTQWGQDVLPFPGARYGTQSRGSGPSDRTQGHRGALVFAANGDNRMILADAILSATKGQAPFDSATPLGFFETEINLFWPLVAQHIDSTIPFPLRLRPETEQE
ncbi:MAG: recombinase family protein, partial [Leptolyngbyaceae cyanobacterium]